MYITLTPKQIADAHTLAQATFARWQKVPGYYNNTINSHLLGKLGEVALESLLSQPGLTVISHFRNVNAAKLCDISVTSAVCITTRIEVKTWPERNWDELGRCIAIGQFPSLQKKCDLVIWCILKGPIPILDPAAGSSCEINVGRWSTLDDVARAPQRLTGRTDRRQVFNYQLDESSLRPWETLHCQLQGDYA